MYISMKVRIWYCVSGSGQGMVFTSCPVRDDLRHVWVGHISSGVTRFVMWLETDCGYSLPPLSWHDEPVPIGINIETAYESD